jgi:methyl-accepting chemotaxis protein
MEEIVASVVRVSTLIGQISEASQEQSLALQQVNQTVAHIDHNTQQNAALVEEASAAAHSLHDQAEQLLEAVARFHA